MARTCQILVYSGDWNGHSVVWRRDAAIPRAAVLKGNPGRFNAAVRRAVKKLHARDTLFVGGGAAAAFKLIAGNGCGAQRKRPKQVHL